jgi:hypothetical protein
MNELLRKFFAPGVPSEQWNLNKWDLIKAFIVGTFAPVIMLIVDALNKWYSGHDPLVIDWTLLIKTAVSCFMGYILKNWITPSSNPPLK